MAALLLTRSVVVMAMAACIAASAEFSRSCVILGMAATSSSILMRRPITPVDSSRMSEELTPRAEARASALVMQSW